MSQKKVVARNVALLLVIICIVFAVALVAAVAEYTSIINEKDKTIADLTDYRSTHSIPDTQFNELWQIAALGKSTEWVTSQTVSQPQNSYSSWNFTAQYAGYIVVTVESSTTTKTYAEVIYHSHGVNYDCRFGVGTSATPAFPVLPSSIEIRVGNTNSADGATETVTITYWY